MELSEKIHQHLPVYLSPQDKRKLFAEISSFPDNIDSRIYSSNPKISDDVIYQGDIVANHPLVFLPDTSVQEKQVFIISNTCDIDLNNRRIKSPYIVYCPIIKFEAYEKLVSSYYESKEAINGHLTSVRKQRITSMFYLPRHGQVEESIVLFDSSNSHRLDSCHLDNMLDNRVISLGNYGFMLFLVKLSIHFTRVEEGVNRG